MNSFKALGVPWPPRGWEGLSATQYASGQAIVKNPSEAKITGIQYRINPVPRANHCRENSSFLYAVEFVAWEYTIYNNSQEFPIISFILKEKCTPNKNHSLSIDDVKIQAQNIRMTDEIAERVMMASLYFIRQVENGRVPDWARILRFYRLAPARILSAQNKIKALQRKSASTEKYSIILDTSEDKSSLNS